MQRLAKCFVVVITRYRDDRPTPQQKLAKFQAEMAKRNLECIGTRQFAQ